MQELDRTVPRPGLAGRADRRPRRAPRSGCASGWSRSWRACSSPATSTSPSPGSCARCLEPFEDTLDLDVQELYAYAGSTTEATSEEDEVRRIEGDFLDLEPLVRDTVVLNLPLAPVCTEDCAGLCVDCGQRLDDLPADHTHEVVDPAGPGSPRSSAPSFLVGHPRRDPHH